MKKRYNAIVLKKFSRFDCKESSSLVKMSNQAISVHGLFIIITKFRHILYRTSEHLSHTEEICRRAGGVPPRAAHGHTPYKRQSLLSHTEEICMRAGGCYPPAWQMTGSQ